MQGAASRRSAARRPRKLPKTKTPATLEDVHRTRIRVVGVGGGGGNIVSEIASRVQRFDYAGANTDLQALKELPKKVKVFPFGREFTNGLGCGMDADLGERSAREEKERIKKMLEGQDICIVVATLGGGTGSGAAPVFAEISHGLRNITFGIFTTPFDFEGDKRRQLAEQALEKLKPFVNAYVVIPNERIFEVIDKKTPFRQSLSEMNARLADALEGFMDTLSSAGLINIDFADVRSVLEGKGRLAYINSAEAAGPARGQEAVRTVLAHPLYDYGIEGADRLFFNIVGDKNLKMQEVAEISKSISEFNPKAKTVFGISFHEKFKERLRITLFAVGCRRDGKKEVPKEKRFAVAKHLGQNNGGGEENAESAAKEGEKAVAEGKRGKNGQGAAPKAKPKKRASAKRLLQGGQSKLLLKAGDQPAQKRQDKALRKTASSAKAEADSQREPKKKQQKKSSLVPRLLQRGKPKEESEASLQQLAPPAPTPSLVRRNALEVRKAVDEEIKELEKKERAWDFPSFLRNK